jgi:transcriptional regulator with XRE-family HTH domain
MRVTINSAYDVGAALRRRRVLLGLSQGEVAQKAGISRQLLSHIEQGHPRAEFDRVAAAAKALGASLVFEEEAPAPQSVTNLDLILQGRA